MRKKDWADVIADEFYDLLSEGNDEKVVTLIGRELRRAYLKGLEQEQVGIAHDEKKGKTSSYIITAQRTPLDMNRVKVRLISDPSLRDTKLTWDGEDSKKKT